MRKKIFSSFERKSAFLRDVLTISDFCKVVWWDGKDFANYKSVTISTKWPTTVV